MWQLESETGRILAQGSEESVWAAYRLLKTYGHVFKVLPPFVVTGLHFTFRL